jgi:hypothetical protein
MNDYVHYRVGPTTTSDVDIPQCGACGGLGYQRNQVTGINERCQLCGGSGSRHNIFRVE